VRAGIAAALITSYCGPEKLPGRKVVLLTSHSVPTIFGVPSDAPVIENSTIVWSAENA
jgi:hypothetical protein